jgi:methionine aminopeptidase
MTLGELSDIRRAVADYMASEGCSCCQNREKHEAARKELAELLDVPAYDDESGYDFPRFRTKDSNTRSTPHGR